MNARDELVDLMRSNRIVWATNTEHRESQEAQADAILTAGYRKPRTITTAEELDALPDDSVVLDEMDGPLIKVGKWWHSPTDEMDSSSVILPAPVLHEGEAA